MTTETDEVLWTSPNGRWRIERHTAHDADGAIVRQSVRLYNPQEGVLWDLRTIEGNTFFPTYVRDAVARYGGDQ